MTDAPQQTSEMAPLIPEELEETFSTTGPVCPNCGDEWLTDEGFYYNEVGYELTCENCEIVFAVQPESNWSWTSRALRSVKSAD